MASAFARNETNRYSPHKALWRSSVLLKSVLVWQLNQLQSLRSTVKLSAPAITAFYAY